MGKIFYENQMIQKDNNCESPHLYRIIAYSLSSIIIISNLFFFIPFTIKVFSSRGGPFGFGLLLIPIIFISHLNLIPAVLALKSYQNRVLLWMNIIGVLGCIGLLWLLLAKN